MKPSQHIGALAGSPAATIGITIGSVGMVVFGLAIGLSCERWATARGQCTGSWLTAAASSSGGGLGVAGTWIKNPYIRRDEEPTIQPSPSDDPA